MELQGRCSASQIPQRLWLAFNVHPGEPSHIGHQLLSIGMSNATKHPVFATARHGQVRIHHTWVQRLIYPGSGYVISRAYDPVTTI